MRLVDWPTRLWQWLGPLLEVGVYGVLTVIVLLGILIVAGVSRLLGA